MNRISMAIALAALAACGGAAETGTTTTETGATTSTTETIPLTYSSSFTAGQYNIDNFSLLATPAEGMDFNGDGIGDNSLPGTLLLLNTMVETDLSVTGFNKSVNAAFASGEAITLVDALFADAVLSIDLLTGMDDGKGLAVDPVSYDSNGESLSHLVGGFTSDESFSVTSDNVLLNFPFLPKTPPLPLTFQMVTFSGDISEESISGTLYGVIPSALLIEEVIKPLVPKEGVEGMTYDEVMALVESILGYPTVSDITFADGTVGISAAFSYTGTPVTF